MTGRVQTLRSNVAGNRPTGRQPGELYVNWPDKQIGVIDSGSAALDLVAVRFFSATASYVVGNYVLQSGKLYVANGSISPGAFNATQWTAVASMSDLTGYLPLAGGTMTGLLTLSGPPSSPLNAATKAYVDGSPFLLLAGGTLTGALTPSQTAGIVGTTTNNNANAGAVGEFVTASRTTNLSVANGATVNVTSISLTAGDWDVEGDGGLTFSTNQGNTAAFAISTTSATWPPTTSLSGQFQITLNTNILGLVQASSGRMRLSLSATTTVYLVAAAGFSAGACTVVGTILARRVR